MRSWDESREPPIGVRRDLGNNSVVKFPGEAAARIARSLLDVGPGTASDLAERLGLTATAIRRPLAALLEAGLVVGSDRADQAALSGLAPLSESEIESDDRRFVVELPDDIVALRLSDPDAAYRWRVLVRDRLTSAFDEGSVIIGTDSAGNYVLERHRP